MENLLKTTKTEERKFDFHKTSIFIMKEKKNDRNIYHTKILKKIHKVVSDKKQRCIVLFKDLFNESKIQNLYLYPIQEGDKFLGIFYGYKKPIKAPIIRYEKNGFKKLYSFARAYYMEFRFKKGS
uniref:DUF226 domain-containing protein n=1 Tax=Borreliella garinii TaxID=29519 RepID=UPI001AEFE78D